MEGENMKSNCLILVACFLFLAAGCVTTGVPRAAKSEYFKTTRAGFLINSEAKEIKYGLSIISVKPIPAGSYVEIHYQDPNGSAPIIEGFTVEKTLNEIPLKSPPISGLKAYANYEVEIYLYDSEKKGCLLSKHTQYIQSLINEKDLKW